MYEEYDDEDDYGREDNDYGDEDPSNEEQVGVDTGPSPNEPIDTRPGTGTGPAPDQGQG
jgi:hypothetical protein